MFPRKKTPGGLQRVRRDLDVTPKIREVTTKRKIDE